MSFLRKENATLVIGLLIPIVMILFIAGAIYLPRMFSSVESPQYDFLYVIGDSYYGYEGYLVRDGKLEKIEAEYESEGIRPKPIPPVAQTPPILFVHDVDANESSEISFEEAAKFTLDPSAKSPDGFEIVQGRRGDDFFPFFSSRDYSKRYIKKGSFTEEMNLELNERNYYNMYPLGWIIN